VENWTVRDLDSIQLWVVALILAIPLSIIANLLTYPLRNWMARRSARRAERRSRELEQQLRSIEALTQSSRELALRLATLAILLLITFALGSAATTLSIILWDPSRIFVLLGVSCYAVSVVVGIATVTTIERVRGFEDYRERTERQIAELKARASREP
jgi:Cft2 family RNA processing exonuclease